MGDVARLGCGPKRSPIRRFELDSLPSNFVGQGIWLFRRLQFGSLRVPQPETEAITMSKMLKSSGAMGSATLASRMLGLVREMVYARFMGVGAIADAFLYAFMIPNLFRRLLGEGALTAAFIPAFKEKERREGERAMWESANAVISGLIIAASGIIALVLVGITLALQLGSFTEKTELMLGLLRIMFPYMLLVCVAAVLMGMLNSRGYFFMPALGAGLLNVVMIATVLFIAPGFGETLQEQIFALAYGVLAAGIAQAGFQLPVLYRSGFRPAWVSPWRHPTVQYVLRQMVPGTIGAAAFQINLVLTLGIAFWVGASIVSSFTFAIRLMEFPQGIFGVSVATFILPTLSGLAADKKFEEFRQTVRQGLAYVSFANCFAAAMMVVLAQPIVRLLFEYGEFGEAATARTSMALASLGPALIGYATVNVLVRAFHALGDIQTPMKISVACLVMNLCFTAALVIPLKQVGLGLANSFSSLINVGLLLYALRLKLKRLDLGSMQRQFFQMLAAALLAGQAAWVIHLGWQAYVTDLATSSLLFRLGAVFVPMVPAAIIYGLICFQLEIPVTRELLDLLRKRR